MRAVIQRVSQASVTIDQQVKGAIEQGLVILLGVETSDGDTDARWIAEKAATLRCFSDDQGRFDQSLEDVQGAALVVSQFTLFGDCRKGRRPSFVEAAEPEKAKDLYGKFVKNVGALGVPVEQGRFQALMKVELVNDGPVTLVLESRRD